MLKNFEPNKVFSLTLKAPKCILLIGIERVIPDHKKPKKISFTSKENLLNN